VSTPADPAAYFREVAAAHPRCFWLDGGGAREWSGRRSVIGWLDDDGVSLTYDAARREVRRHVGIGPGSSQVVGDDVFTVLEAELAAGDPSDQWFGYFGYACRPDLPAFPDDQLPDAVWMRASHVRMFEHPATPTREDAAPGGRWLGLAPPERGTSGGGGSRPPGASVARAAASATGAGSRHRPPGAASSRSGAAGCSNWRTWLARIQTASGSRSSGRAGRSGRQAYPK
jgi:hypothetical protein